MKKLLFVIVLLVIIGVTLMMTCPDRDVHYEALKGVASEVINAEMNESKIEETMASVRVFTPTLTFLLQTPYKAATKDDKTPIEIP